MHIYYTDLKKSEVFSKLFLNKHKQIKPYIMNTGNLSSSISQAEESQSQLAFSSKVRFPSGVWSL